MKGVFNGMYVGRNEYIKENVKTITHYILCGEMDDVEKIYTEASLVIVREQLENPSFVGHYGDKVLFNGTERKTKDGSFFVYDNIKLLK